MEKLALVLLIALLPAQALAAIIAPLCQQDAAAAPDHGIHGVHQHVHDAPDQDQTLTVADASPDHCGAGSAFAIPAILTEPAPAATAERSGFAAASRSGFIPEQPQRPPRAVLL